MTTYEPFVCYKCEANEVSAPSETVHPLCSECEKDFDTWFEKTLEELSK